MMYRPLNEIFDAILSISEEAAYGFAQKFSFKDKDSVLYENVQYTFGDDKYSVKFEERAKADTLFRFDKLYLYGNTKRGLVKIGEAILI